VSAVRDLVLVDTGIWAAFFSKPASAEKREIDSLLVSPISNRSRQVGIVSRVSLEGSKGRRLEACDTAG
jgi:hypothetical protein